MFRKNYNWVEKRVEKDLNYLQKRTNNFENFAIISVDMQKKYLKLIFPKIKEKILVLYHKKLKELSKKNNIKFIEIEYNKQGKNILYDNTSIVFKKDRDSVASNVNFINYLQENQIENLYIIGINRNNCVLSSIYDLEESGYNIFTSIIGTGSSSKDYELYLKKQNVKTFINGYNNMYEENNMYEYTLRNNIDLLIQKGIEIIDYKDLNEITKEIKDLS